MGASPTLVLAAALVGSGLAVATIGILLRWAQRGRSLAELLELAGGGADVPVAAVTESPEAPPLGRVTARLGELVGHLDARGAVAARLARAGLPLRSGEYLLASGSLVSVAAVGSGWASGSVVVAVSVAVAGAVAADRYLRRRARQRSEALRAQLPEAFALVSSAVASGHTFLRAIQLLREQVVDPLGGELDRVVAEVTLGSNLIDALERFAARSAIDELRWAVQAVRIQQTTGGQLAELLHTLADFMRAREQVHREVTVLTAEGRFSALVLLALPFFVGAIMEVTARHYLRPMFHGWGIFWLGLAGLLLATGIVVMRRLVAIEV